MMNLGTLGGTSSQGQAINNLSQVTGYSFTPGNTQFHAFLYHPNLRLMEDLGTLGGSSSMGLA
jgi:probable HAF family extracellular repeat protein